MSRAAGLLSLLLLLGGPASAQAPGLRTSPAAPRAGAQALPPAGQTSLVSIEGFVEVQRSGQDTRRQVQAVPLPLFNGDRVHTYRRGEAVIMFSDGSKITLGDYSVFAVEAQTSSETSLHLILGRLRALVSRLKGREFRVRTAVAVASVRGTEFEVGFTRAGLADVAVHEGLVSVANLRGDEILLSAAQRLEVFQDRMGRIEHFDARPERGRPPGEKKPEPGKRPPPPPGGEGPRGEQGRLKEALHRELGFLQGREAMEKAAIFEHKNALHQEGKTLLDAFGQRVRVESFMARPDPFTFKQVTLNFREGRLDTSSFEVTANAPLPPDLRNIGSLWFSMGPAPPPFFATRQRWKVSNGIDSVVELAVDGQLKPTDLPAPGLPVCPPGAPCFLPQGPGQYWQTVFGNTYEFINGDPGGIQRIWNETGGSAFRPGDNGVFTPTTVTGMTFHQQPVLIVVRRTSDDSSVGSFWQNVFVTRDPLNLTGTGKTFVAETFAPTPGVSHFVEKRSYIDFVAVGKGFLDFGEPSMNGAPWGEGGTVYLDRGGILHGLTLVNFTGGTGIPSGAGGQDPAIAGIAFFADGVGGTVNGTVDGSELISNSIAAPNQPALILGAASKHREGMVIDHFTINDLGQIQPFFPPGSPGNEQQNAIGGAFQQLSFQRVLRADRFQGRKIDLVLDPHLFIISRQIKPQNNADGILP